MNCQQATALFSDQLEGLLTGERRAALEAHLESCSECGPSFASLAATVEIARDAYADDTEPPLPDDLVASILAARRAER